MKKVLAIILSIAMVVMALPFSFGVTAAEGDNRVLFTPMVNESAVSYDEDGKIYYQGYSTYGKNGLGYTPKGFLRTWNDGGYNTSDGNAYLFAHETDGEQMWKFSFNVNAETGGHAKSSGGGTYIYPFYSSHKDADGNALAEEDMVKLGDKVENADEYTHLAVRVKLIDDGTGNAVEDATHSISINPLGPNGTDGHHGYWAKPGGVYLQDIKTGEKTYVRENAIDLPIGFDGYVVFPSNAVIGKVDGTSTFMTLADFIRLHIMVHWNCSHSGRKATDSWVGTELYIGDMIITKNIESFNLQYTAPVFDVESDNNSVTVLSDDENGVYAFDKEAENWLTKEEFNAVASGLSKETEYTVYGKYPSGNKFNSVTVKTSNDPKKDNKMLFAVTDDTDGKLYYSGYKYAINGLGYAKKGFLRTSGDGGFTTGDGSAYLFAHEIDNEKMWKFQFGVNTETGAHSLSSGGSTYIYPFYSALKDSSGTAIPSADIENLADNVQNPERFTHMAVRVKLVDDGTGNAVEGATHSFSLNPYAAETSDGYFGAWAYTGTYLYDINTGKKTSVTESTVDLPLGFDGYVVYPSSAVTGIVDGNKAYKSLAEFTKLHIYIHWGCSHSGRKATDSWVGTELYIGDMILTKNIDSFNLIYGAPSYELESNDNSVTVISDDANAVYAFSKTASEWFTKDEINAKLKNLPKETEYTVYAKYALGTKITSKTISTTNTGIASYLMDVPEEETWLTYNSKNISWGSAHIVMTGGADPLSANPSYASGSSQGLFVRKSGDEHFIVFNPDDKVSESTGLIPECNVGVNWNTISGRGLTEAGEAKVGMPENIDKESIKGIAMRFKITGGEADQYSSVSFYLTALKDWLQVSRAYLIDNKTGLVMNPYFQSNSKGHLLNISGEFDGWLVLPYEYIFAGHRKYFEETGGNLALYFHTNSCDNANHGKDATSDWTNKIFWLGDIALIDNEDSFINTFSRPVTDSEGMVFTSNDHHTIDGAFTEMTNTFETWIKFNDNYPDTIRGGMMLSNANNASDSITYQILANGNPSVSTTDYSYGQSKSSVTKTFDKVNVYTGEWTHLAIVNDQTADTITCYINGVAVQTLEGALADSINREAGVLGGSFAPGNPLAFRGEMKSVALYSDARTAEEIAADMTTIGTDSLMAHWDLSKDAVDGKLTDESGNKHDITLGKVWFNAEVNPDDYDYSFAIVGDTQYVNYNWSDRYDDIYDWIVENKEERKIEYVLNMGDMTENSSDAQWARAATEHAKLDGLVPYTVLRGNHDKTDGLNATFNKAPYNTSYSGSYDGKVENTWRELVVCGVKYLIFTLDIGPSDDVLNWAGEIIEDHPYHNVIITTHVYLDKAGTPMDSSYNSASTNSTYGGGGNDAEDMWDKLIGKYENIVMVLCGHVSANTAVSTTRVGEHGNVVTQMLVDPQGVDNAIGATGMVTLLNFSENGTKVTVETLSTVRDMHFISQGQYEMTVPVTEFVDIEGDVTGNGIRDARDLVIVRKALLGMLTIDELNIDINNDSKKDIRDIVAFKRLFIK